eukprot:6821497-Pyramimonas_sp.AAC.1
MFCAVDPPGVSLSPQALALICFTGATPCFLAASTGITQTDLKRVIACSTCGRLGYMVFACTHQERALEGGCPHGPPLREAARRAHRGVHLTEQHKGVLLQLQLRQPQLLPHANVAVARALRHRAAQVRLRDGAAQVRRHLQRVHQSHGVALAEVCLLPQEGVDLPLDVTCKGG